MQFVQLALAALSLSAVAGGTWGIDRMIDRHARAPDQSVSAPCTCETDEDEDPRLLY